MSYAEIVAPSNRGAMVRTRGGLLLTEDLPIDDNGYHSQNSAGRGKWLQL